VNISINVSAVIRDGSPALLYWFEAQLGTRKRSVANVLFSPSDREECREWLGQTYADVLIETDFADLVYPLVHDAPNREQEAAMSEAVIEIERQFKEAAAVILTLTAEPVAA
jgi:hypothetical protein